MEYVEDPSRPLMAHTTNPFLQPKTPLREKIVHASGIIGVGIIALLLFYVLFLRGGTNGTRLALAPNALPTSTAPKNSVVLDKNSKESATILWSTYTNARLNYSIQYPTSWKKEETDSDVTFTDTSNPYRPSLSVTTFKSGSQVSTYSAKEYFQNIHYKTYGNLKDIYLSQMTFTDTNIGGISATYIPKIPEPPGDKGPAYWIQSRGNVYYIYEDRATGIQDATLKSMVASFRLL